MTKKLLTILLMGSFTTFATDLHVNDTQVEQQASKLEKSINEVGEIFDNLSLEGDLSLSDLRADYMNHIITEGVMPKITHAQIKKYIKSGDLTFTVEKDGETFVFSANKEILMTQYSGRVVSASTPVFSGLTDATHAVDAEGRIAINYTYCIGLYLHRGYHTVNLMVHSPNDVYKEKIKSSLINKVDMLFKGARKLNKAHNLFEHHNVERYEHLK